MNPVVFNQFTYMMLLVSISGLLVYGLVRACVYIPEEWSWLAAGIAEVLTVVPASAAMYRITNNFELSSLVFIFFAIGTVPALAPRLYKYRTQQAEAGSEKRYAEGVLRNVRNPEE